MAYSVAGRGGRDRRAAARYQKRGLKAKQQSYEVQMRAYKWNITRLGDVMLLLLLVVVGEDVVVTRMH
eukprot:COSAG02_NODE_7568_length_2956_cov_1.381036_2_plen_68_part_00